MRSGIASPTPGRCARCWSCGSPRSRRRRCRSRSRRVLMLVAMALRMIEVESVLLLLGLGRFALWVNALALVVSAAVSWFAALQFGLAGAAAGGVAAAYFDRALLLRRISTCSGIPLGELQDWRGLGRSIAVSALVALGAWAAAVFLEHSTPFACLALAGTVLAALCGVM